MKRIVFQAQWRHKNWSKGHWVDLQGPSTLLAARTLIHFMSAGRSSQEGYHKQRIVKRTIIDEVVK